MENKDFTVINDTADDIQEQNPEVQVTISLSKSLLEVIDEIISIYCEGINITQEEFIKGLVLHGFSVVNNIIVQEKQATLNFREQAKQSILSVFTIKEDNQVSEEAT